MTDMAAWLEAHDGQRWKLAASCSIGRANTNTIVIEDGKVSRRHALIHRQDAAEFWVIDLGSGNGTYVNGRRLTLSTPLDDGDTLTVGEVTLTFRKAVEEASRRPPDPTSAQTIIEIRTLMCWLLVADIKGSTALAASMPTKELAMLLGKWLAACKEIIDNHGGLINKYLGDGFLAYWYAEARELPQVVTAINQLVQLQRQGDGPKFRLALHRGAITIGGAGSQGEDSLSGSNVIRVFRMEKLAGSLACDALLSEEARAGLEDRIGLTTLGGHALPGFDGLTRPYFTIA